jgi:hypothetical protein
MGVIDAKKIQREVEAGSRAFEYELDLLLWRYIRPSILELAKATPRPPHQRLSPWGVASLQACAKSLHGQASSHLSQ